MFAMDSISYGIIACIGCLIGLSSGMFGIGGALIATPLLHLYAGLPEFLALGTPLPAAFPSSVTGSLVYIRHNLLYFPVIFPVLLGALPANICGTLLTQYVSEFTIMILTGGFLLLVGTTFFIRGWLLREQIEYEPHPHFWAGLITGVGAGLLSGFLAIGGGIVLVPAFVKIHKLPLKKALATSLACVCVLTVPGTITHYMLGHIDPLIALILSMNVVPFSYLGSKITVKVKSRTIERIYGTAMVLFALYFMTTLFR